MRKAVLFGILAMLIVEYGSILMASHNGTEIYWENLPKVTFFFMIFGGLIGALAFISHKMGEASDVCHSCKRKFKGN